MSSPIYCGISWCDCNGVSTAHSANDQGTAVMYVVLTVDHHVKRFPICAEHLKTLMKRVCHHDPHCNHPSQFADHWTILGLDEL